LLFTQSSVWYVPETVFHWVKRHGRETDQPPSSTEVMNSVVISTLPRMPLWHVQVQRSRYITFGIENVNYEARHPRWVEPKLQNSRGTVKIHLYLLPMSGWIT
jgi:hypothetical protein